MPTGRHRILLPSGLLTFDGRSVELFKTDGRDDGWRVRLGSVERVVVDEVDAASPGTPGEWRLRIYTTEGHLAMATGDADQRAGVDDLAAAIADARRSA